VGSTSYVAVELNARVNDQVDVDDHERHVEDW
jgi:hypothetical protein